MPAIQAMRSDALAMRSKDDIQEKIPSFYNSVNQALGNTITKGQDNAEQLITSRYEAANKLVAELKQKLDGQSGVTEAAYAMVFKLANRFVQTIRDASGQTDITEIGRLITDFLIFNTQIQSMQEQFDAAAAVYAQWIIQAGYAGNGLFFDGATLDAGGNANLNVTHYLRLNTVPDLSGPGPGSVSFTEDTTPPSDLAVYDHDSVTSGTQVVEVELGGQTYQVYHSATTGEAFIIYDRPYSGTPGSTVNIPNLSGSANLISNEYDMDLHYDGPTPSNAGGNFGTVDVPGGPIQGSPPAPAGFVRTSTTVTQAMRYTGAPPDLSSPTTNSPASMTFTGVGTTSGTSPGSFPTDLTPYDPAGTPTTVNIQITDANGNPQTATLMESASNPGSYYITYQQEISVDHPDPPGPSGPTTRTVPQLQVTVNRRADEFYRGGAPTGSGTRETITLPDAQANVDMFAMGGRGAIRYRDGLTPRWTDRRFFAGSQDYDAWYGWGSVGSITRIGQERT